MATTTTAQPLGLVGIASGDGKTGAAVVVDVKGDNEQHEQARKHPLNLLDLPVDILQLIVKEITHTNDLTALALTNSALHNLAIPLIYSRFDIVWPDGNVAASESKSVDALTYGLSTLCLGSAFARATRRNRHPSSRLGGKFGTNQYAKYTKKFSLGNGPKDWVEEYMITKESGKMLGTLVAIAIAKMTNLEAFVWDMPTGVLSDIFMALGSLGETGDDDCKLNRVWVRWHDNSDQIGPTSPGLNPAAIAVPAVVPPGSHVTPVGIMLPADARHPAPRPPVSYSAHHCEYPTFSVLPPLKSLTVLDIDELSYLDEMAVLIERSKESLRELRVGIAEKASHKDFAAPWDGPGLRQVDHYARWPGESIIGERRLGGVLGVLVGKIYDIRKGGSSRPKERNNIETSTGSNATTLPVTSTLPGIPVQADGSTQENTMASVKDSNTNMGQTVNDLESPANALGKTQAPAKVEKPGRQRGSGKKRLEGKLKLETLELERVPLSMQVCRSAFDWSTLTSLTILDCAQHDTLWKILRKSCQPTPISTGNNGPNKTSSPAPFEYHLSLKHIHTDSTTPSLIAFIKETLAPNTLEVLFLQDRKRGSSPPAVQLDAIFKGALKRHRASLQKLLLDSSAKPNTHPTPVGENNRWKSWVLNTEVLVYITSGRMPNLRELAVSLDYKDWHTFLQRLPNIPHLHSINIPNIVDYVHPNFEPRELAHQMTDIITLRPEIRLCYIGIGAKCFEILESRDTGSRKKGSSGNGDLTEEDDDDDDATASGEALDSSMDNSAMVDGAQGDDGVDNESTSEEEEDDDEDGDGSDDDDNTPTSATTDPDDTQTEDEEEAGTDQDGEEEEEDSDEDDDDFVEPNKGGVKLRLREILFYDDKVAVFKARHGRL